MPVGVHVNIICEDVEVSGHPWLSVLALYFEGIFLFAAASARIARLRIYGDSPVPPSHIPAGMLRSQGFLNVGNTYLSDTDP